MTPLIQRRLLATIAATFTVWASVILLFCSTNAPAQSSPDGTDLRTDTSLHPDRSILRTEAVGPIRFVAVHGTRSVVMGYPDQGLEIWGYPFEILSGYQVGFRSQGVTAEVDARLLLRRIDYAPESVTRTYVGPDYLVRERIFVPLDRPAAIITYEVEGSRQLDINIHFQPVLDLMWPGGVGGQYTRWLEEAPGFQISEPGFGISAVIGSTETIAHDDTLNSTVRATTKMAFTIRPHAVAAGVSRAKVYVVLNDAHTKEPAAAMHQLSSESASLERQAEKHYDDLRGESIRLHTPDNDVNQAVAWAVTAIDQAWACNPKIGCGLVAGYGPSRDARRPQYAWFFAGDGLVATNALISAGEYARAKQELEFITKYQEPNTGMIWHELSQSAGFLDWSKYPYMYVHVDISFDYLAAVGRYVATSGDTAFANSNWSAIMKVYSYCRSIVREGDHLPHIPADKEGGDEQARPGDDLGLSAEWLAASSGFAELARETGHVSAADEARQLNLAARSTIPAYYWNAEKNFWIDGHTQAGAAIISRRRGPSQLIEQNVFSSRQNETVLDQLASADFRADWGMREVAASSPDYDPYSYGRGSVTAPSTGQTAVTFWKKHRPAIGFAIWSDLIPWNTLDAPGHIHEVLAGNFYHEQAESVPEQTWSSSGLLDATVRGLLGLTVQGDANSVEFAPHMPAQWDRITIENVRLPSSKLSFTLLQDVRGIDLQINNQGSAAKLSFEPEIPLGAHLLDAEYLGRPVPAATEIFSEDEHAKLSLEVPPGASHCRVRYEGGVSIILPRKDLHVGDRSTELKLTHLDLEGRRLVLSADVPPQGSATLRLRTPWKIAAQENAVVIPLNGNQYEVTLTAPVAATDVGGFHAIRSTITFAPQ